jgi:DNA-binding transcriptional LysR family regulator
MVLTEAGSLYLLSARESVRQARLGVDHVQAFVRANTNDLRVGQPRSMPCRIVKCLDPGIYELLLSAAGIGPKSMAGQNLWQQMSYLKITERR